MIQQHNPLYLAKEAQSMAKNAGARHGLVFQNVATVSMCMVAVLTGMHLLMQLWRELHRSDADRGRGR
jgi:hypothetical protein